MDAVALAMLAFWAVIGGVVAWVLLGKGRRPERDERLP